MSFGCKTLSAHVRHPDLQWPQAPLAHAPAVLADSFPHRHENMLHVTPESRQPDSQIAPSGKQSGYWEKARRLGKPLEAVLILAPPPATR